MKEPEFYIQKADEIISNISEYQENRYSENVKHSLDDLVLETELLLFKYSENYPALLDIKQMKERYNGVEFNFTEVIIRKLISVLTSFKSFLVDLE